MRPCRPSCLRTLIAVEGLGPTADFGVQLRRLRRERGWTLRELGKRTQISGSQLGNIENGRRKPTPAAAALCDQVLGARGGLIAAAESEQQLGLYPGLGPVHGTDAAAIVAGYSSMLHSLRELGRNHGPQQVTVTLAAAEWTLRKHAAELPDDAARSVWLLAARFAEYASWIAQESDSPTVVIRYTDLAVRSAARGGDPTMAAYAMVRRALMAQQRGDSRTAVLYADRAATHPAATPRIRAHAVRRAAQGYAIGGDLDACRAQLDRCAELVVTTPDLATDGWGPRIGPATLPAVTASCLLAAGAFEPAAALFDKFFHASGAAQGAEADVAAPATSVPPLADNSLIRFRIRRATAYAGLGLLPEACRQAASVMPALLRLDSATARADLLNFLQRVKSAAQSSVIGTGEQDFLQDTAAALRRYGRVDEG